MRRCKRTWKQKSARMLSAQTGVAYQTTLLWLREHSDEVKALAETLEPSFQRSDGIGTVYNSWSQAVERVWDIKGLKKLGAIKGRRKRTRGPKRRLDALDLTKLPYDIISQAMRLEQHGLDYGGMERALLALETKWKADPSWGDLPPIT